MGLRFAKGRSIRRSIKTAHKTMTASTANSEPKRCTGFYETHVQQSRKQYHGALRKIEYARSSVDENESKRHRRVHHACQQPPYQCLKKQFHSILSVIFTKVSLDHNRVVPDPLRRSVGDLATVIQHYNVMSQLHDNSNIMFYKHDGGSKS